jgi:hypothetical protein
MLNIMDFDEAYGDKMPTFEAKTPAFVGSYPPVAPAGEMGPFFVNTYLLQPNRKMEVVGTVSVRSADLQCRK